MGVTLLAMTGLEEKTPDNIDGISIAATLSSHRQARRPFLYREFSGYGGQQAVWMGKWKGIRQNMLRKNNADPLKIELYNLQADIGESKDVAAENPQVVARIRTLMEKQHSPSAAAAAHRTAASAATSRSPSHTSSRSAAISTSSLTGAVISPDP